MRHIHDDERRARLGVRHRLALAARVEDVVAVARDLVGVGAGADSQPVPDPEPGPPLVVVDVPHPPPDPRCCSVRAWSRRFPAARMGRP